MSKVLSRAFGDSMSDIGRLNSTAIESIKREDFKN